VRAPVKGAIWRARARLSYQSFRTICGVDLNDQVLALTIDCFTQLGYRTFVL
jgi:hypothetical protein